ncbi:hypothetical protein BJ166DRAFT_187971 [Pestalotiopsis sp. NC0098]|nr:hypothetical protein BJ166DRAFT_187971 [Pestalotiopsis sp. NC0098]
MYRLHLIHLLLLCSTQDSGTGADSSYYTATLKKRQSLLSKPSDLTQLLVVQRREGGLEGLAGLALQAEMGSLFATEFSPGRSTSFSWKQHGVSFSLMARDLMTGEAASAVLRGLPVAIEQRKENRKKNGMKLKNEK